MHGYFELVASQGLNSVKGKQIGVPKVVLNDGTIIRFQAPNALLNVQSKNTCLNINLIRIFSWERENSI